MKLNQIMKLGLLFRQYKYSLSLYLILMFFVLFFGEFFYFEFNLKVFMFMPFIMFLGTFSFVFPFRTFASLNGKKMSLMDSLKMCIAGTYLNIIGKGGNEYFFKYFKISTKEKVFEMFRVVDYLAMLFVMCATLPFIYLLNEFYIIVFVFIWVLILFLFLKDINYFPDNNFFRYFAASVIKYPIESMVPLFLLWSFGFDLSVSLVLFFTASTCVLYYVPKFKLAGGLISLYMIAYSYFLGKGIVFGFIVGSTLRISSVLFFVLPVLLIRRFRNASKISS